MVLRFYVNYVNYSQAWDDKWGGNPMNIIAFEKFRLFIAVIITSLLIACGGGGNDSGGTTPGPTGSTIQIAVFLTDISNLVSSLESNIPANDTNLQASVTLVQGTTVLTELTDSSGIATFNNIPSGSFTVTGQYDYTHNGNQYRAAQSIHNINPPNGQLGLLVGVPDIDAFYGQVIPPVVGTMISGTVRNIPNIPTGYSLFVHFGQVNDGLILSEGGIELVTGNDTAPADQPFTFSAGIGGGDYKVAAIIRSTAPQGAVTAYSAGAIHTSIVSTTGAMESTNIDVDFSDSDASITFANKSISAPNYSPSVTAQNIEISSVMALEDLGELYIYSYAEFGSSLSLPTALDMVQNAPVLAVQAGYELVIESDANGKESRVPVTSSTMSAVTFNLINPPTISSPIDGSSIPLSTAENLNFQWTVAGGNPDFYLMAMYDDAGTGIPGITALEWRHLWPGDTTDLSLPVVSLPMIGVGASYSFYMLTEKQDTTFDFDSEFNFDGTNNSIGLENDIASTEAGTAFSINVNP